MASQSGSHTQPQADERLPLSELEVKQLSALLGKASLLHLVEVCGSEGKRYYLMFKID